MSKLFLGTREITPSVYKDAGTKYGVTIDALLGDVEVIYNKKTLKCPTGSGNIVIDCEAIQDYAMYGKFTNNQNITGVSFPNLTSVGGSSFYCCFSKTRVATASFPKLTSLTGYQGCMSMFSQTRLQSIDLHLVTTISSDCCSTMFSHISSLTSFDLSSLESVTGTDGAYCMFSYTGITNASFPKLKSIGYHSCWGIFYGCSSLVTATFGALDTLTNNQSLAYAFSDCSSLTDVYFPALKSTSFGSSNGQFNYMLQRCSNVTVHFPSNLSSIIGSWSDVTRGFDGTNTTVLFDLPATS